MEKKQYREKENPIKLKEIKVSYDTEVYESYGEPIKVSKDNFPFLKKQITKLLQTKKHTPKK